jgi:ketosteroid isomerase-like protein
MPSNRFNCLVVLLVFALVSAAPALSQQASDRAAERGYIQKAEADWAEAVASNDCSVAERILADEFVGVEVDGTQYTRADSLQSCRTRESNFEFCHAQEVDVRFYGDTAIARGSEKWKLKSGKSGVFVWTDTWIKRGGKWQVVAAEDLIPSPSPFANAELWK